MVADQETVVTRTLGGVIEPLRGGAHLVLAQPTPWLDKGVDDDLETDDLRGLEDLVLSGRSGLPGR